MINFDIIELSSSSPDKNKINELMRAEHLEIHPNDPYPENKLSKEQEKEFKKEIQPLTSKTWLIKANDETIGYAILFSNNPKFPKSVFENGMGIFKLYISKEYRRKKAGTLLISKIISEAKKINLIKLYCNTYLEEGKKFLSSIDGILSSQTSESRLYMNNIDKNLIERWNEIKIPTGYTIEIIETIEEQTLTEFCEFYSFLQNNTTIDDKIEKTSINYLPENRRFEEKQHELLGNIWLTLILKNSNNNIIGLTEMIFDPKEAQRIRQNLTGIDPEYRGNGFGRLIKSKLLKLVMERYSSLKYVYTGNNITNQSIIDINNELGYKTEHVVYNYMINL